MAPTDYWIYNSVVVAQSAGAIKYTDCIYDKCPRYNTKQSDSEALAGALGNTEYPFTAITSRSTLARSGSTW